MDSEKLAKLEKVPNFRYLRRCKQLVTLKNNAFHAFLAFRDQNIKNFHISILKFLFHYLRTINEWSIFHVH